MKHLGIGVLAVLGLCVFLTVFGVFSALMADLVNIALSLARDQKLHPLHGALILTVLSLTFAAISKAVVDNR
jgi:hypothetical protein